VTPPPPVTRLGAQHAAHAELAKAIYHRRSDPLIVRAIKALGHWLSSALHTVPSSSSGGLWLALLVLPVVVVGFVISRRVGPLRRASAAARVVLPTGRTLTAAEHRSLADAAAARGDHETAVLESMRAVVRALEERGVIEPRPGRTAVEVAREGGNGIPAATPVLIAAARTFDDVVYGGGSAGPDEVETLRAADRAVARR
jgi:Domain of unknown function (DUF4129)